MSSGTSLAPWFAQQFFDNDGLPLAGGFIYTYAAGTTNPLAAYTDNTGTIAQTNPIILDGSGRAPIWLPNEGYKFIVQDANNVTLYTVDQVNPFSIGAGSIVASMLAANSVTQAAIAPNAVGTAQIQDGAVTFAKLAVDALLLPDFAVGPSQAYTTINAAIAAAVAGQSIYVQTGIYTENLLLSKQVNILGSGRGAVLNGSLEFATGSDYSIFQNMKVLGGITIDTGVQSVWLSPFWNATGQQVIDNGTGSFVEGIQE